jgi:hypothetical protein
MDFIPGFMVDCHGEEWLRDDMPDMNGPFHYQSWSIKTLTDTTWIQDTPLIKNPGWMCF